MEIGQFKKSNKVIIGVQELGEVHYLSKIKALDIENSELSLEMFLSKTEISNASLNRNEADKAVGTVAELFRLVKS